MKISPVQGTPTIPQPSNTGLSPDKIARLKDIASGKPPEEKKEESVALGTTAKSTTQSIKMSVNKTPEQAIAQKIVEDAEIKSASPAEEPAVSDTDVQTLSEPEAIQPISPQLAAIAKQKRALQVKEQQLAEREKALEAQPGRSWDDLQKRVSSGEGMKVLQELGGTYDSLTNELLGNQGANEIAALNAKIAKLEKGIDERFTQNNTAQEQAVYDHMRKNVDRISASSDEFKLIKEFKAQEKVMDLIQKEWKENGEVLDEEDAMKTIEEILMEDAKRYAKAIGMGEAVTPQPAQSAQSTGIKTLTNKDSARPNFNRRQRAIAAMLGQK